MSGQTSNSVDLGQYPRANSLPVTLANDSAFTPNTTYSGVIGGSNSAAGAALNASLSTILLTNAGPTNPIFFRFGAAPTAVATDCCLLSGQSRLFNTGGAASISAITSTSTAALYYTLGTNGLS